MESEKSTEITSDEHPATKPAAVGAHISQIPGLSSSITPGVPETRGRRVRVLDTDSEYVKLAKQGGHKGLLCHEDTSPSSTGDYKRPDWLGSSSSSPEDDGKTMSEKKKNPGAFQQLDPPFGTDNMSAWERQEDDDCSTEKNNNNNNLLHSPTDKPPSLSKQLHATGKFRRIVFDKKPAPVDMSKLLSFGYADDDKPTADNHASN